MLTLSPEYHNGRKGLLEPESSHIRSYSVMPQSKPSIPSGEPAEEHDSSKLLQAKPVELISSVEPVSLYPCIKRRTDYHIDIGFRRREGDGSCCCRKIDMQTAIIDFRLLRKASYLTISLRVRCFLISVTQLWDMIICQCKCKGRTHHVKVLDSKSHCTTAKTCGFFLQVTAKWQCKCNISDEMC